MTDSAVLRPKLKTTDSLDRAPRLSGSMTSLGIAQLKPDNSIPASSSPSMSAESDRSLSRPTSEREDELEDYDAQKPDLDAMVQSTLEKQNYAVSGISDRSPAGPNEIPIRLEKIKESGLYNLRADDPDIREILKRGLARQNAGKRQAVRDLVFTRRFTTFDRQNPQSYESPFHGFFTLFWLGMALMFFRVAAQNWRQYGSILGQNEVMSTMFSHDVLLLGIVDGVMWVATLFGFGLQKVILSGWLNWDTSGYIIENLWQAFYLGAVVGWAFYREWPWTHTVFIVLHAFVFVMKQHSYSFYNGYLSQVFRRRQFLERKQKQLEAMSPMTTTSSPRALNHDRASSTALVSPSSPTVLSRNDRRKSGLPFNGAATNNLTFETEQVASVAQAISSDRPLTQNEMNTFSDVISDELAALTQELKGKCSLTQNYYPSNLRLADFAIWTCFPTLVYELEYPRQDRINWWYVAEKTAATFGVIGMMMVVSQAYIYPPVLETVRMKEAGMTVDERWAEFPWIVSDMLFPLLLEQLLTWYVIWECILNVLAELTRFADRGFYGDWWNSVSFDQYARDWNRPVHNFLLRHVYHSSISAFHLSKTGATFVTFLLSACVHELLMFCMFKKVRGYLFWTQLLQVPLVALSKTKFLKGKNVLGNIVFWIGLFIGPSFLTSLYLVI
ncbi:MAG: acyl-CoA/sterol acyltransferase [Chrysothrix sp. TS-e1954]|nr:MAG: acyl-CoA/sterol acyltransferase [Chrysothrix sp. TS-e1954]